LAEILSYQKVFTKMRGCIKKIKRSFEVELFSTNKKNAPLRGVFWRALDERL